MCPWRVTCSIHLCLVRNSRSRLRCSWLTCECAVRRQEGSHGLTDRYPFRVHGAPNVFLETIKRGEDDDKTKTTIVLRLYEAFGGHALAELHIGAGLGVKKASLTNMMEDDVDSTELSLSSLTSGASKIKLNFHRFEVKTVKLVIGKGKKQ